MSMSSDTLSAVLEKLIRHLCLTDFPCGYGGWRKTKDSADGAETEETDVLLDLLSCPHSPWWRDVSWSPQAPALRRLAVLSPKSLHADFIYNYLTTLRIMDKGVSVIDDGLLKFSKLEELVLSGNNISEIPSENLPSTLKILELRVNRLSALNSLTSHPPPRLQYLGLSSNSLSSHKVVSNLTGRHWPQLVCLDLSDCEFQDQQALLSAVSTLPRLKTLALEGNPFTLAPSYPGFTVDSLPQLSCLDASWISPEERHRFRGLAEMSDLIVDWASVTVSVGRVKGIPDPEMSVDENVPDFPVVTYRYFITYEFLSRRTPVNLVTYPSYTLSLFSRADTGSGVDADPQSMVDSEETCRVAERVSRHSTSKQTWSECMDFSDTQVYVVSDLGGLKKFLHRGLYLTIEEEKVLSWPAASEDVPVAKTSRTVKEKKGKKGKESPVKSGSTKDKSKDKKKKAAPELVQDAPIRRGLGSVHVPLRGLVKGGRKVDVLCDLGALRAEAEAAQTLEKEPGRKVREDRKREDKESKRRGGSGTERKNAASSKGKGKGRKGREADVHADDPGPAQPEPATVELTVELEQWRAASDAHHLLPPQRTP